MKRLIIAIVLLFCLAQSAEARTVAEYQALSDNAGVALNAYALTSGTAVYSQALSVRNNVGFISLLITEDKAGDGGDVDISVEYSMDGSTFHTPYNTDLSGTITADGNIVTALGNVTRWIIIPARLARYMRYKFDPDADSQITVYHVYQFGN